jgi:hypothetical protein
MGSAQQVNVDVTITPDPTAPDGVRFGMSSNYKQGGQLTFKNSKKGDWFEVDFNIIDDQNTGYLFPDDKDKAMYVKTISSVTDPCPDDWDDPQYWDQFEAKSVTGNNRTLKVKNLNETIQLFAFCLWFTKTPKQNGPCIAYDPIGSNQNAGGRTGNMEASTMNVAVVTGVVVIVALVGFALWGR